MLVDWTFEQLQKITDGIYSPVKESLQIKGFSIDTRSLQGGDIFCALKGKNHDGHDFLGKAYENGASCFILSDTNKNTSGLPFIKVNKAEDDIIIWSILASFISFLLGSIFCYFREIE